MILLALAGIGPARTRVELKVSAKFDSAIAKVILGADEQSLLLPFGIHVRTDGELDALNQVSLLRFCQPSFDLGGVTFLLFLVLQFAKQEFSLKLFPREILDELHQIGFRLHEGIQLGVDFRVNFELFD